MLFDSLVGCRVTQVVVPLEPTEDQTLTAKDTHRGLKSGSSGSGNNLINHTITDVKKGIRKRKLP